MPRRTTIRPDGCYRTTELPPRRSTWRIEPEPEYRRRNEHVIFSPVKPPMAVMFWNISSVEQLKRTLMSFLEGEYESGEQIRSIKRLKTRVDAVTGATISFWNNVEYDNYCIQMMHGPNDIVLTVVIF